MSQNTCRKTTMIRPEEGTAIIRDRGPGGQVDDETPQ